MVRRREDEEGKGGRRERIVYTSQGGHQEVRPRITAVDLSQEEDDGVLPRPVRRGLLWQQKDRFFSRWKERFFILTQVSGSSPNTAPQMSNVTFSGLPPLLQERVFKDNRDGWFHIQGSAISISMLSLIFPCNQCKLSEVEEVSLLNKRGYLTVSLTHSKVN